MLGEGTRAASEAARARDAAADALPGLREEATARAAALQRLVSARQGLDEEEARARSRQAETEAHLAAAERDLAREQERLGDAGAILARLAGEETSLLAGQATEAESGHEAERQLEIAADGLARAQEHADRLNVRLSEGLARRDAIDRFIADEKSRLDKFERAIAGIHERREELVREAGGEGPTHPLAAAVETAAAAARQAESEAADAERESAEAQVREGEARGNFEQARRQTERLETEIATLVSFLEVSEPGRWPPLADALTVKPGFEAAVGAALGDELEVPTDAAAPMHWRALPPLAAAAPLPEGAEPLADFVAAPRSLDRRLLHIGIVEATRGAELQEKLEPGQSLVSRQGQLWRWDGLTVAGDVPAVPARRLAEKNRLRMLEGEIAGHRTASEAAQRDFIAAHNGAAAAQAQERAQREAWRAAVAALDAARRNLQEKEREGAERRQQLSAIEEAHRRLGEGASETRAELAQSEARLQELAFLEDLKAELETQRETVAKQRTLNGEARAHRDDLEREARLRRERLLAIVAEQRQWNERSQRASLQIAEFASRTEAAQRILAELSLTPAEIEDKRTRLLTLLTEAEAGQRDAADALATGESGFRAADGELRTANEKLSGAREEHARSGALVESGLAGLRERQRRIVEQFGCAPEDLARTAGFKPDEVPGQDVIEHKLAQLRDERERLGGVNLLAEQEAATVQQQLDGLKGERDDLVQAIAKLRGGIQSLNREGRQRLIAAFDEVNRNFGALFTTLFGGGRAELQLIESEDPLEAGLEILAHPPGKKPQVLSLLSGGEQALTALALIFAVFLSNPSPICVLDEVDAPLDDHNVERFCNLLDAMLERTDTRFLIITHHALTMARMHRLFGVTMMERGVSQLVSVDLKAAEGLREAS